MTVEERDKLAASFTSKMQNTLMAKGADYAGNDVMSNFKRVGNITNITPSQCCLVLIATKVARLGELLDNKVPKNESIDDSILDLANYAFLLHCLQQDEKI